MSRRASTAAQDIPAHNLDTERAVLGAIMQADEDACSLVAKLVHAGVTRTTFYPDAHRIVFAQLSALVEAGRPTTPSTVITALREAGEIEAVGGALVIQLMAADATVPAMVMAHAEELMRLAAKRELEQAGRMLVESSRNGAEPAKLTADLRSILERLDRPVSLTPPEISRIGDDFTIAWPARAVTLEFQAARPGGDGLRADVAVTLRGQELDWGALPLASTTARVSRAGKLTKIAPGFPWGEMLDTACALVARTLRAGDPAVVLDPKRRQGDPYLIEPLIPIGRPTVVHADGGSGKSYLAVALALARFYGLALPGMKAPSELGPALYLDYETDRTTLENRLDLVGRGFGVSAHGAVVYRRMVAPLVEAADAIRRDVSYYGTDFVIVDSLQYAVAGNDRGDVALPYIQAFNVLRSLGPDIKALILAHHSHVGDEKREAHPYGSRFIHNNCGARWELRFEAEDATDSRPAAILQALYNRKINDDAPRAPLALRIVFDADEVRVERGELKESVTLLERAPLRDRIRAQLAGGALDVPALADATGAKPETIRRVLERYANKDWTRVPDSKPIQWGLKSARA